MRKYCKFNVSISKGQSTSKFDSAGYSWKISKKKQNQKALPWGSRGGNQTNKIKERMIIWIYKKKKN